MLCQVCEDINFRPLSDWGRPAAEIEDETNSAFQWAHIDDEAVRAWKNGDGVLQVYYFYHASPAALRQSAEAGCYLCAVIYFALFSTNVKITSEPLALPPLPETQRPVVLMVFLGTNCRSWQDMLPEEFIRVFCGPYQCRLDSLDCFTESPIPADQYLLKFSRPPETWEQGRIDTMLSTWSLLNQKLAMSWFLNCLVHHDACKVRQKIVESQLPKRVIDLGPSNQDTQPVLLEPAEGTPGTYVTLTYCWGDLKPLPVNLTQNEHVWLLPLLSEWPVVFQHAVTVTKALGVRYLWIDSLCISQSSKDDWEVESGRMAHCYQNSTPTIAAAAAARSDHEDLFTLRNPLMTCPHHLKLKPRNGHETPYERMVLASKVDETPGDSEISMLDTPLYSRAWVLQEELLSPRVLRFGHRRMCWECRSCFQSKSVVLDENFASPPKSQIPLSISIPDHTHGWSRGRNPHYDVWYRILSRLNARNITYQHDILPSISGVAQILHDHLIPGDEYLAGIWRLDLTVGLLWCKLSDEPSRAQVKSYRPNFDRTSFNAPSWSWISMAHKQLCFQLHPKIMTPHGVLVQRETSTKLLSAKTVKQNISSPYGSVRSGSLTFLAQCPVINIFLDKVARERPDGEVLSLEISTSHDNIHFRHVEVSSDCFPRVSHFRRPGDELQIIGDCILDDEPVKASILDTLTSMGSWLLAKPNPRTIQALFLPLLNYDSESLNRKLRYRTMGLALIPVHTGRGIVRHKRVGRAVLNIAPHRWKSCTLPLVEICVV